MTNQDARKLAGQQLTDGLTPNIPTTTPQYLVSFTIDNMTYARLSDTVIDAVTTMREANIYHDEAFYRDCILQTRNRRTTRNELHSERSEPIPTTYSSRIASNIVLTIIG